ncbi:hypothetical protein ABBQ32_003463 [Trebouxia sp. C0010 RCD-2024]
MSWSLRTMAACTLSIRLCQGLCGKRQRCLRRSHFDMFSCQTVLWCTLCKLTPPLLVTQARHTFSSPADLLRTLNAEGYMQAQEDLLQKVQTSYEIHTGSPWIQSRPVFVLVNTQPGSDVPVTYTLKTKVNWTAAEDELSKVLKRRRKDGSALIKVDQLRDGVVLFEDVADAERYSNYLEADNSSQVMIAQCDSHNVFRNVQEVRGVVVLLRKGSSVPMPHQLAVSLRSKQSFEND